MVGVRLTELTVYAALASLGQKVLFLGLLAWLVVETYRLITKGQCDYLTPCVRYGVGALLLRSLPAIHQEVSAALFSASEAVGDRNLEHLFTKAYEHAVGGSMAAQEGAGVLDAVSMLANVLSFQGMFAFGSVGLALAMQVVKVLVLHILWPLCLGLVVAYGALAIPLGVLPGMSNLKGWFKNLVEVAIWPLVFQTVVSLLIGSFERTLASVARLDIGRLLTSPMGFREDLQTLISWWAICLAYLLLCLLTPLLASMVVRSTPISIVGGLVAAQAVRLMSAGVGQLAGAGLGRFIAGAASSLAGGAVGGAAQAARATTTAASAGGSTPSLDQRTHRSAPSSAPKGDSK